jgi:hypothetical protein
MREAVQRLTTIRFKLGDHVRDRDSGIRGTVVYVPSDPALAGSLSSSASAAATTACSSTPATCGGHHEGAHDRLRNGARHRGRIQRCVLALSAPLRLPDPRAQFGLARGHGRGRLLPSWWSRLRRPPCVTLAGRSPERAGLHSVDEKPIPPLTDRDN